MVCVCVCVCVQKTAEFQPTTLFKIPSLCLDGKLLVWKISMECARPRPYIYEREECLQLDFRSQISDSSIPAWARMRQVHWFTGRREPTTTTSRFSLLLILAT
jgi:hypothetical protein